MAAAAANKRFVERAELERALRTNVSFVHNLFLKYRSTPKYKDQPIIFDVEVNSIKDDWQGRSSNCVDLACLQNSAAENPNDREVRCLLRAMDYLQPFPHACAVFPDSATERFKTSLFFINFDVLLPELKRGLVILNLAPDDVEHKDLCLTYLAKLEKDGVLTDRWIEAAQFFTNGFYKLKNERFYLHALQHDIHAAQISALAAADEFFPGTIAKMAHNPAQEGFVAMVDEKLVGFVLFESKRVGLVCNVHLEYVLIARGHRGLGSSLIQGVDQKLEQRFFGCEFKYNTEVKTTDQATHFWLKKKGFLPSEGFIPGVFQPAEKHYAAHPLSKAHEPPQ